MKAEATPKPPLPSNFPLKYTRADQTTAEVEVPVKEKKVTINLTSN
jgi:hypothetical protein